jgi:uncharacterized membrane protein
LQAVGPRIDHLAAYASYRMSLGASLFLIAVGAILRYAVTESVSGIDIPTVGLILMVVGIIGLVLSIAYMFVWPRPPAPRDPYDRR